MTSPAELTEALARFLSEQVQPAITDPGLGFRVRIAAWLMAGLAREARLGASHRRAQADRLAALLDTDTSTLEGAALDGWRVEADRRLAHLLRQDALDAPALAAARAHLLASLGEALDVVQPTFDRRLDVEGPAPRAQ